MNSLAFVEKDTGEASRRKCGSYCIEKCFFKIYFTYDGENGTLNELIN